MNLPQPGAVGEPTSTYKVSPSSETWVTPASLLKPLAQRRPEVRYVLERYGERHAIFVILEKDPEDLLDAILELEVEIRRRFRKLPFDLRIMTPGTHWEPQDLLNQADSIYERDPRAKRR